MQIKRLLLMCLAFLLLAGSDPYPNGEHPAQPLDPAATDFGHQCNDERCERCFCAKGFKCTDWKHTPAKGGRFRFSHVNKCVRDGNDSNS